jgi:Flp pilus assembly protein TadD
MRIALAFLLLLLSACSGRDGSRLGTGQPSLAVARAALSSGSPEVAAKVAENILLRNPLDLGALLIRGDALAAAGHSDGALASYTRALTVNSRSTGAKIGLGRLQLATDPRQAELLFLSVLEQEPRHAAALNNLGIAHDLQGDHVRAQDAYRRALGADPTMRAAEVNLALSMALNGRAARAVQILGPLARDESASRRLRHGLAAVLAMAGDKEAARKILAEDLTLEQIERALLGYEALRPVARTPGQ